MLNRSRRAIEDSCCSGVCRNDVITIYSRAAAPAAQKRRKVLFASDEMNCAMEHVLGFKRFWSAQFNQSWLGTVKKQFPQQTPHPVGCNLSVVKIKFMASVLWLQTQRHFNITHWIMADSSFISNGQRNNSCDVHVVFMREILTYYDWVIITNSWKLCLWIMLIWNDVCGATLSCQVLHFFTFLRSILLSWNFPVFQYYVLCTWPSHKTQLFQMRSLITDGC